MSATLYLYVDKSIPELYDIYKQHIYEHNKKIENEAFSDAGFDIFVPESQTIRNENCSSYFMDFKIKMEMTYSSSQSYFPTTCSYYLYHPHVLPRSLLRQIWCPMVCSQRAESLRKLQLPPSYRLRSCAY